MSKTIQETIKATGIKFRDDLLNIELGTGDTLNDVLLYWLDDSYKADGLGLDAAIKDLQDIAKAFGLKD